MEKSSYNLVDQTDLPIFFEFLREVDKESNSEAADIWFNIENKLSQNHCDKYDLDIF